MGEGDGRGLCAARPPSLHTPVLIITPSVRIQLSFCTRTVDLLIPAEPVKCVSKVSGRVDVLRGREDNQAVLAPRNSQVPMLTGSPGDSSLAMAADSGMALVVRAGLTDTFE